MCPAKRFLARFGSHAGKVDDCAVLKSVADGMQYVGLNPERVARFAAQTRNPDCVVTISSVVSLGDDRAGEAGSGVAARIRSAL